MIWNMDMEIEQDHAERYTVPRAHPESVVKLWIERHTEIGPALEVKIFCHLDDHGLESQIPRHIQSHRQCLGGHIPRPITLRGRVTIQ